MADKSKITERRDLVELLMDKFELIQLSQTEYLPQILDIIRITKGVNKNKTLSGQNTTSV